MIFHFYPRTFSLFLSYERYLLYKGGWGYGEGGRGGEGIGGGGRSWLKVRFTYWKPLHQKTFWLDDCQELVCSYDKAEFFSPHWHTHSATPFEYINVKS